jgi:hypothetical protein
MSQNLKLTVLTVTNNKYFYYLEKLIASAAKHCPKAMFYIELVNVPKYKIESLKYILSTYRLQARIDESNINFCSFDQERGYCTNRRVHLLRDSIIDCDQSSYYLYLDVNTLICGDVEKYLKERREFDAFLIKDENHYASKIKNANKRVNVLGPLKTPYFGIMTAGIQIYKATERSIHFLNDYFDIVGADNCSWYADQEGLYLTLLRNPHFNYLNIINENVVAINSPRDIDTLFMCVKGGKWGSYEEEAMKLFYSVEERFFNAREDRCFPKIVQLSDERSVIFKITGKLYFFYNKLKHWKSNE